jgi:hypothetical protein
LSQKERVPESTAADKETLVLSLTEINGKKRLAKCGNAGTVTLAEEELVTDRMPFPSITCRMAMNTKTPPTWINDAVEYESWPTFR